MIKVNNIGELNEKLNDVDIDEIKNISIKDLTINGDNEEEELEAYISFKDSLDYFDYIEENEVELEILITATVFKKITMDEYKELRLNEKIAYVELHDDEDVMIPETTYESVSFEGKFRNDMTSGHIDTPDVYGRWAEGYTGAGVKIGIIDNYFEETHGSNGTVDVPYEQIVNFTGMTYPHAHGVEMGSIMGARMNGNGLVGSAPDALLYGLATASSNDPSSTGMSVNAIISAINWCLQNKMDVVSMSLSGSNYNQTYKDAIKACVDNNIIVVCAAGNNTDGTYLTGQTRYPAAYPETITVSASQYDPSIESYINVFNYTDMTDVSCPVPRRAYLPKATGATTNAIDDKLGEKSLATSGATAYMAGIIATIKQQFPGIHRDACLDLLLDDSIAVQYGMGRVPRLSNFERSQFAIKKADGWKRNKEDQLYYSGIGANQRSSRALEMIGDSVIGTKLDLSSAGNKDASYLFAGWPFRDFPKFDDGLISKANYMFSNIKVSGFLDLSFLKLANVPAYSSINIFNNLEAESLDISGLANDNVANSSIFLNGVKVKSIFVANTTIASRIADGFYLNFNVNNLDNIFVGKANSQYVVRYLTNLAGAHNKNNILTSESDSVTIKTYDGTPYFHSPTGKIAIDLSSDEYDLFISDPKLSIKGYVPSGSVVNVKVHSGSLPARVWNITPNSTTKLINSGLISTSLTENYPATKIVFSTNDGTELYAMLPKKLKSS